VCAEEEEVRSEKKDPLLVREFGVLLLFFVVSERKMDE